MKKFFEHLPFISIFILSYSIHRHWIFTSILQSHDWSFRYPENLVQIFLDTDVIFLPSIPIRFMEYLFGVFGFTSQISDPIIYFIPIILLPLLIMHLFNKLYQDSIGTFIVGLILIGNSYFLSINAVGHNLITVSTYFLYASLLSLFISHKYKNSDKRNIFYYFSLLFLMISGIYDFRVFYIGIALTFLLYGYLLLLREINIIFTVRKLAGLFLVSILTFTPFIIGAIILNDIVSSPLSILERGLFEMQFSIVKSQSLFHPYWSSKGLEWFVAQPMPFYFLTNTFAPICGWLALRKTKLTFLKIVISILLVFYILGVFLSKQTAMPFGFIYKFLFNYFPGFGAFREATKFYTITLFANFMLIGLSMNVFKSLDQSKYRIVYYSIAILISFSYITNVIATILSTADTLYIPSSETKIIQTIRNTLFTEVSPSNILWINMPQLYTSTKFQRRDISISDAPFCKVSIDNTEQEGFDSITFLSRNNISNIYVNDEVSEKCITSLFGNEIIPTNKRKLQYIDDNYDILVRHYRNSKKPQLVHVNPTSIDIAYNSGKQKYFDIYFTTITFSNINSPFKFEYPKNFSTKWIALVGNHIITPTKSKNNLLLWKIDDKYQSPSMRITLIHYPTILVRSLVLFPIGIVLYFTVKIINLLIASKKK